MKPVRRWGLTEYKPYPLASGELTNELAQRIWDEYGTQIEIETPSFKNQYQWILKSRGWVGHIPISGELGLDLLPKVPLENLFGMYEYAYRLESFHFLKGLAVASSLNEFYEQLAHILSKRILDRGRKGYYRTYVAEQDSLPYVRG
ncbi:MAG: hypothetical protein WBO24_13915, partial [Nitrospirales bacterium]